MFDAKSIFEWLKDRSPTEKARVSAYLLAPGLVLGLAVSSFIGGTFSIDFSRPITISELRTEIKANGNASSRLGFALLIEPTASEYRIPLLSSPSGMWSSLNEQEIRANQGRLLIDSKGISGKAPFLGIGGPVTIVVDSPLGKEIQVPGGTQKIQDLLLQPRRSVSLVSSVLLACVFAFGISIATGLPPTDRKKHAAG